MAWQAYSTEFNDRIEWKGLTYLRLSHNHFILVWKRLFLLKWWYSYELYMLKRLWPNLCNHFHIYVNHKIKMSGPSYKTMTKVNLVQNLLFSHRDTTFKLVTSIVICSNDYWWLTLISMCTFSLVQKLKRDSHTKVYSV